MTALLALALAVAHPGGHERLAAVSATLPDGACSPAGLVERGRIHAQLGAHHEALADFTAARACAPDAPRVDAEEARVWLELQRPEVASLLLAAHLDAQPHDVAARAALATALAAEGRWAEADAAWETALSEASVWQPDAALDWSTARELARGPEAALAVVEAALARMPGTPALEDRAVALEVACGRYDQALARLDARLARAPHDLAAWARRGDVLASAGRAQQARDAWGEAVRRFDALPPRVRNGRATAARDQAQARLQAAP